ncbi:MAG: hypothetical protein JSR18_14515 [Proteobacteria bacterium]|nr:hypothetical protein [Pseudomonadota bacterium]
MSAAGKVAARLVVALWACALAAGLQACPLCLSAFSLSVTGQELGDAQRAVLAVPAATPGQYQVVEVIKGDLHRGQVVTEPVFRADSTTALGKSLLLLKQDRWAAWVSFGAIATSQAAWLRYVAATPHPGEGDVAAWSKRVAYFMPLVDSDEPMVSDIALAEIARAPYAAMRAQKPSLDAAVLRQRVDAYAHTARAPYYTLLLGVAGDASDAARLEQALVRAHQNHDVTNVGPMLGAYLELRGPSRLAWVESTYFVDRRTTLAETEAAIQALGVQGDTDAAIPRADICAVFHRFVKSHPQVAGMVAGELAEWNDWSAAPAYLQLLQANAMTDAASRYAAVAYLLRSPHAQDKAALRTLGLLAANP